MKNPYKLILGSGSPRRRQLMRDAGYEFRVRTLSANENFPPTLRGGDIALFLSEKKAAHYPEMLMNDELLITADTIVWIDGMVLNKPATIPEARQMLQLLSGKKHEVFTGVCLTTTGKKKSFVDVTNVYFKELSAEEIDYYIKNHKPFDKAGGYGAQDWLGLIGIERIEGSYFNVMGLPMHRLYKEMEILSSVS